MIEFNAVDLRFASYERILDVLSHGVVCKNSCIWRLRLVVLSSQTLSKRKKSSSVATSPKKRWKFVVLGILFGFLGLHLAYAKRWFLFLLFWAGLICGNVMSEKKTTVDSSCDPLEAWHEQSPVNESEKESSNSIMNAGFAVWALLWIGGTLFIKKDGNGCRM